MTDQHGAPILLSATDVILTVHFDNTKFKRHCWLCDLIQGPLTLPEEMAMPKNFLVQAEDTFRFQYDGKLIEATKSAQFTTNIAQMQAPKTTFKESDRPSGWTFLKGSLVSTDAETLRLESAWQRFEFSLA